MINTIYLDHEFNFLLLESTQEENRESTTKIYLNIKTDATTGQRLEISVAGGAVVTENIASDTVVNFELSQEYWADDAATEITPKNDDITGETITINFPKTFTTSAALNYVSDTEFDIQAQNEAFAESGSSGSGGSGGAAFDFVETIRNIGFRLLDEPSNVNAYFDEAAEEIQIKWTDPADISTNEPAPAEWAGTVVVRKEGSAPLHRWDGDLIVDSTTRDQYASSALVDNTLDISKNYYYGIFPYDTKGDYRFTKVIAVSSIPTPIYPVINSLSVNGSEVTVNYEIPNIGNVYDTLVIVAKKGSAPTSKTDGKVVNITYGSTSKIVEYLDKESEYYFRIFAESGSRSGSSDVKHATTGYITKLVETEIRSQNIYNTLDGNTWSGAATAVYDVDTNSMKLTIAPNQSKNFYTNTTKDRTKLEVLTVEIELMVKSGNPHLLGNADLYFLNLVDIQNYIFVIAPGGANQQISGTPPLNSDINSFHKIKTNVYYNAGKPYKAQMYKDNNLYSETTFSPYNDSGNVSHIGLFEGDTTRDVYVKKMNLSAVFINE